MHRTKLRLKQCFIVTVFTIALVIFLSEYSYYNEFEKLPSSKSKTLAHEVITHSKLEGHCDLYYREKTNEYWLFYTNNENKKNYVAGFRDVNGNIDVSVVNKNKIAIKFNNKDQSMIEDVVYLDLDKNETYQVSVFSLIKNLF